MPKQAQIIIPILILVFCQSSEAVTIKLPFLRFLKEYQIKSPSVLDALQSLSSAENQKTRSTDQWQGRLTATPQIGFLDRKFENGAQPDISNRTQNLTGQYTQSLPTGTTLELNGQKFLEIQNPLFSSIDRSYSARISQDLIRNSFGRTQRAISKKANLDYSVAQLRFRQSLANACEEAFSLYADTYIQQEIASLLQSQLEDAKKARAASRKLYRDRLINKIDKLSSESDFITTQLRAQQAQLMLVNNKRQIMAYVNDLGGPNFTLSSPAQFLGQTPPKQTQKTLNETIIGERLKSQEMEVDRARTDRWTDLQLGLEVGERVGRRFSGSGFDRFNEDYLNASLTIGFDVINNSENSELNNAIRIKNHIAVQDKTIQKTQTRRVENLYAMNALLKEQVKSSDQQVKLLKEKMNIAFNQMKRARLDFENYLLHRNAFLNQKVNFLNLQKDLLLNEFSIQKEYAHLSPKFCEAQS